MKKILSIIFTILLLTLPFGIANTPDIGTGVGVIIEPEDSLPLIWINNDARIFYRNPADGGAEMIERTNNYAFEGEQISWQVLVMDKSGAEKIRDVFMTTGDAGVATTIIETHTQTFCEDIPSTPTNWDQQIHLPKFNQSLGNLTNAQLSFATEVHSQMRVEHLSTTAPANYSAVVVAGAMLVYSDINLSAAVFFEENGTATPFDGILDYNGTSGTTFPELHDSASATQNSSNLQDFIANSPGETLAIDAGAQSNFVVIGPGNYATIVETNASAEACVTYTYQTEAAVSPGGDDIQVNCDLNRGNFFDGDDITDFNARILEEQLTEFDEDTMAVYDCTLTVETPNSMYGEYAINAYVQDLNGNLGISDETEHWFFNPVIALAIEGDLTFENVLPGSAAYSDMLKIINDADDGSGVLLDMSISGTDFYDPTPSGAKCPVSNRLRLNSGGNGHDYSTEGAVNPAASYSRSAQTNCDNPLFSETAGDVDEDLGTETDFDAFCYYASNGAYSTENDLTRRDVEGYVGIPYETGEESDRSPIISSTAPADRIDYGGGSKEYFAGNVLSPGDELSITLRLFLPEPCKGTFTDGSVYFWGEAI